MFLFSLSLKTVWYLYQKHSLIQMKPLHWKDPKHSGCHPTPTPSPNLIPGYNSPFHSWVLGCQAFLTGVRLRVTLLWYKPHCFAKLITLLLCKPDTGLYPNKVTFSLTPNQRLSNHVHNCKIAYWFNPCFPFAINHKPCTQNKIIDNTTDI